jgi:hypothetical protein
MIAGIIGHLSPEVKQKGLNPEFLKRARPALKQ